MVERPLMEQFYHILETFQILWPYQQSIKYFAVYEEKINCAYPPQTVSWLGIFCRFLHQDGSRVFQTPGFRPPSEVLILLILCVLLIIVYSIMVLVVLSFLFGPFETPYHVDLKTAKISLTKMDETFSDFCWKLLPTWLFVPLLSFETLE